MTTPNVEVVRGAAANVMKEMQDELSRFALYLFPSLLTESFGGWLLPAETRASPAARKSYELHKLIERVEDRLRDATNATITIDLQEHPNQNGH